MYEINPWNANLYDFAFDGDKMLISRQQIYCINDDIIKRLNNGFIIGVYTNRM